MGVRFSGTYRPRLDDKGRLFLPARYRTELAGGVMISKGRDGCLYVYRDSDFSLLSDQIDTSLSARRSARDFARRIIGSAYAATPDRAGRVSLTPELRRFAGLLEERDCVVVGVGDRLELWAAPTWDAYEAALDAEDEEDDD